MLISLATAALLFQVATGVAPGAGDGIDTAVRDGIAAGAYPGAVVVVGRHDTILYQQGYGHFTWAPESPVPDAGSTLFDLASLTKVVATTPAVMALELAGKLDLDVPVRQYLPEFAGQGKEAVTVRHLLSHTSGLRAYLPLHELAPDGATARRVVMNEPLRWRPGSRVQYSDLNALLLGWIVEAVAQSPLDEFVAPLHQRLGMFQTRFNPPRAVRHRVMPVGLWRGTPVGGSVHDQNAAIFGGVAGHAGLFSTGRDLARYAQAWLRARLGATCVGFFPRLTVEAFSRRGAGNRGLGWELRDTTTSDNTGHLLSRETFGHTGFTGTSLWIDPGEDLFVIVLTNRVFAPRTRRSITRLKSVRGDVADAAIDLVRTLHPALPVADGSAC